jgi:uncharacterized membrane protein
MDARRIRDAIEAAERGTSAEIVVSVSPFFVGSVWAAARRAFRRLGVAGTRRRNGVLIFVVPSRHQLVVLADDAIHDHFGDRMWRDLADRIAAGFGRGQGTDALVEGIELLGQALAGPFPRAPDDVNELPDLF